MTKPKRLRLLSVARWPVGGIRTYLRYVYCHLPACYEITVIAASTHEDRALERDAAEIGARLLLVNVEQGDTALTAAVFRELRAGKYDVVHSQGFTSGILVYAANLIARVPHVLTVHGILEDQHLKGWQGKLRRVITNRVIRGVDVLYAVSDDMLGHLREKVPHLDRARCRKIVIPNGIDVERFDGVAHADFRGDNGIGKDAFVVGFLGRFMQQKGFNFLIDAVEEVVGLPEGERLHVVAVGTGDYEDWYKNQVRNRGLADRFTFLPFQKDVASIYAAVDVVAMPSIWEASGLLAMEALCSGVPLIASDCIGLRETVAQTPALVFPAGSSSGLAGCLRHSMQNNSRATAEAFVPEARKKFDVRECSAAVDRLLRVVAGVADFS